MQGSCINILTQKPAERLLERLQRVRPDGPNGWRACCPAHGSGKNNALSVALEGGRVLLHCFAGCKPEAVLQAVGLDWKSLYQGSKPHWQAPRLAPKPQPNQSQASRLKVLWDTAKPTVPGDLVHRYLQARGLSITPPDTLRLAWLDYWHEGQKLGRYPVMLAQVVHPVHGVEALHRTYLDPSGKGKADVPSAKKLTKSIFEGAVMGAAIKLYPSTHRLALAEGIETALAVRQGLKGTWPVWATVSAGGLERVVFPKGVLEVAIWADHDKAGLEAANKAARRFLDEGRTVRVLKPDEPGADWLDVLGGGL